MSSMNAKVTRSSRHTLEMRCKPDIPEKVVINGEIYVGEQWYQTEGFIHFIDNIRKVFSTVLTLACVSLIFYAIGRGYAALDGSPIALYIIFIGTTTLLGYLEGLQICILALERVSREPFKHMKRAYNNHRIATAKHGLNVQRFLVGRQFFVVFVVFLNAQVTTYTKMQHELASMPYFLFVLIIETGLPGALTVLAFGQLMPQLIASTHPVTFMNLPGSWFVLNLCLCFESVGVTHFSWVLTFVTKSMFGMKGQEDIQLCKSVPNSRRTTPFSSQLRRRRLTSNNCQFNSFICEIDMDVNIVDSELKAMYNGANQGMSHATADDLKNNDDMQWVHDSSAQIAFRGWGYQKRKGYPTPEEICKYLINNHQPVPRYLLPRHHPKHIPPHICVLEILRRKGDFCPNRDGIEA